ncbi:MAG: PilZ domain-containing protein [bacterium]
MTVNEGNKTEDQFRVKAHEIIDELSAEDLVEAAYFLEDLLINKCAEAAKSGKAEVVGSERRVFKRLRAHVPVAYKTLDEPGMHKRVSSLDISTGGISFVLWSADRVRMGDYVELSFTLPGKRGLITVQAQIKRVAPAKSGSGYEVGVEFIHITDDQQRLIDEFIGDTGDGKQD